MLNVTTIPGKKGFKMLNEFFLTRATLYMDILYSFIC